MQFPLSFSNVSLWLAITVLILLATSELLSPYCGQTNLPIHKKRLRETAILLSILFILTFLLGIYETLYMP